MIKSFKYVLYDIIRNKFVIGYTLLLLVLSISFFSFDSDPNKGILSLLNIILIVIPLVSVIFSTIHLFNSSEFIALLAAQPMSRKTIYFSQYLGLSFCLVLALIIGIGLPSFYYDGFTGRSLLLLASSILITLTFISIAFLVSMLSIDKAKAMGWVMMIWFYLCILYDGIVLIVLVGLSDYPMEKASLILTAFNPMDLARVLMLMQLDISALMGITGAIFRNFFTSTNGILISLFLLIIWAVLPVYLGYKVFRNKDL